MKKMRLPLAIALLATTASVSLPTEGWSAVDELIVTTRKRSESLQDVPLSVAAFTGEDITRRGILSISDLSLSTPGLSIEQQTGGGLITPVVRGMAQNVVSTDLSYDNNVGIFVNGVYQSGRNSLDMDLVGIDRVEVARGPQSALYGRSTFAGAINYVYADPTDEFQGEVSGTLGTDDDYGATMDVGGPIVADRLGGRLSLGYREFDGTFKNLAGTENVQGYESFAAAGALVFTPTDQFTATFNGLYSDKEVEQDAQFLVALNCGGSLADPATSTYYCGNITPPGDVDISPNGKTDVDLEQYSLKLEYETDSMVFTSMSAMSETGYSSQTDRDYGSLENGTGLSMKVCDPDAIPALFAVFGDLTCALSFLTPLFETGAVDTGVQAVAYLDTKTEDFSQEIRVQSNNTDGYSWMAGAFYYESETSTDTRAALGNSQLTGGNTYTGFFAGPFLVNDPFSQNKPFSIYTADTEAWALFGQLSWDITDQLSITGEARYTHEEKETHITVNLVPTDETYKDSFNYITPRLTLEYKPNDDMLFYASAAQGVRTGGINGRICSTTDPACTPAVQEQERFFGTEENWTYELGAKTSLFDNRLQLNGAVYVTDWSDTQLPALNADGQGTHVVNVDGGVDVWGLELDAVASLSDMVTFTAGYAYTEPEFKGGTLDGSINSSCGLEDDPLSPFYLQATSLCSFALDDRGLPAAIVGGNTLGRVAQHQGTVGVIFNGQMANTGWDWYAQTNVNYQSENYARSINALTYGERTLVNMRGAIMNENLEIALWANNLFDEEYVSSQALQPGFDGKRQIDGYQGTGRRVGVTGTYRF